MIDFPIDVVYTWVEGIDPIHQELLTQISGQSKDYCRFANNHELYYSLYSVYKFAPWVRKIFIVIADYQQPQLQGLPKPLLDKIHLVKHSEIMPASALPTFNSMAIESCLHLIAGLSEHFIYFNDDMFLGRAVKPQEFFTTDGRAHYFVRGVFVPYCVSCFPFLEPRLTATINAYMKWRRLSGHKPHLFVIKLLHQCYPCNKSLLAALWQDPVFKEDLHAVLHSQLRRRENVYIIFLMYLYGRALQKVYRRHILIYFYMALSTLDLWLKRFKLLRILRPKFFCINNSLQGSHQALERQFIQELSHYFDGVLPPK